jgi:hypothetical protein
MADRKRSPRGRRWLRIAGPVAVLVLLAVTVSYVIEEPLRRRIEREMNERLKGYEVTVRALDFHPLGFSIDLKGLTVIQQDHPDPPVMDIPQLTASVHWRALLSGRLVADFHFDRPRLHVNLIQLREEAADETPVTERGWQEALQAAYPLKINLLQVEGGSLTYVDTDPDRPLHLSAVDLRAGNIRNIESADNIYPSDVRLEGIVFDEGKVFLDGQADFLADPHPGITAFLRLDGVDLGRLRPILSRYNLVIGEGTLAAEGEVEYAPGTKALHLHSLRTQGVRLDYVHTETTAPAEKRRAEKVQAAAREATDKPATLIRIDEVAVLDSDIGFVNKAADPAYRVFLAGADLRIRNLSNRSAEGEISAEISGTFMGSGAATATAAFRLGRDGTDFDVAIRIENTQLPDMNDLLRAYGNFDVVGGFFSFYSELQVRNGRIEGYIKPLFRDMDVYDRRQDKDKGLFQQLYESLVGGVAKILENRPRDEVATVAEIFGDVGDPELSVWQVVVRLVQNAFFRAILPGFEDEFEKSRR